MTAILKVAVKTIAQVLTKNIDMFNTDLGRNLYKVWNRMSSDGYFPTAVRTVSNSKETGYTRPLGIR